MHQITHILVNTHTLWCIMLILVPLCLLRFMANTGVHIYTWIFILTGHSHHKQHTIIISLTKASIFTELSVIIKCSTQKYPKQSI